MQTPPPITWDTTGYGQQAGGTHPTGMYSFPKCVGGSRYGVFTLTEIEPDTEIEKEMACMKLYGTVHTDRDPLTLEFMESVSVFESDCE